MSFAWDHMQSAVESVFSKAAGISFTWNESLRRIPRGSIGVLSLGDSRTVGRDAHRYTFRDSDISVDTHGYRELTINVQIRARLAKSAPSSRALAEKARLALANPAYRDELRGGITISTQNLSMAQAGFGTPIIIVQHDYLQQRVQSFSSLAEIFNLRDDEKEVPEEERFNKHPLYLMASTLFSQSPTVAKVKLGKRYAHESVTEALNNIIKEDADGDFYGVLLLPNDAKKDYVELADAIGSKRLLAGIDLDDATMRRWKLLRA